MLTHQTSDHFAGADKLMAHVGGGQELPLLNPGDAFEDFDTVDLQGWHGVYKRKLAEDRAALRTAAMNHLRTRNVVDAIDHELTRRHQAARAEEA